jgi:hypothetical protein
MTLQETITPSLLLETSVILDRARRSTTTREPGGRRAPSFLFVRGAQSCAWAIHVDVAQRVANELDALASEEPAGTDWRAPPIHSERYAVLLAGEQPDFGPSFAFPDRMPEKNFDTCLVEDERLLAHHFSGWIPGEIDQGRAPVIAIVMGGAPVSVCFCARLSDSAAQAGVETATAYRGRGLAPQVTAAWASALRERGRIPMYRTAWTNRSSLAVARKLELSIQASVWVSSPR